MVRTDPGSQTGPIRQAGGITRAHQELSPIPAARERPSVSRRITGGVGGRTVSVAERREARAQRGLAHELKRDPHAGRVARSRARAAGAQRARRTARARWIAARSCAVSACSERSASPARSCAGDNTPSNSRSTRAGRSSAPSRIARSSGQRARATRSSHSRVPSSVAPRSARQSHSAVPEPSGANPAK